MPNSKPTPRCPHCMAGPQHIAECGCRLYACGVRSSCNDTQALYSIAENIDPPTLQCTTNQLENAKVTIGVQASIIKRLRPTQRVTVYQYSGVKITDELPLDSTRNVGDTFHDARGVWYEVVRRKITEVVTVKDTKKPLD